MTDAERKLWALLRNSQLGGFSFRRQHPIGPYVVDFYCSAVKLVVELDGGHHAQGRQKRFDDARTRWLKSKSIFVLRFWNNDVLGNPDGVLRSISIQVSALAKNDPHPASPFQGEVKSER